MARFIYMDDAGTSASEPVSTAVAVMLDGDKHWVALEEYRRWVLSEKISPTLSPNFIFHAKDVINAKKPPFNDHAAWPIDRRVDLIVDFLRAWHFVKFSIVIGYATKEGVGLAKPKMPHASYVLPYAQCVMGCERIMRDFFPTEIATIVCADAPEPRRKIREVHDKMRREPFLGSGFIENLLPLTHVIDGPHFAEPRYSPMLQFADAYAFAARRLMSNYSGYREELRQGIYGNGPGDMQAKGPGGGIILHPNEAHQARATQQ